MRNLVSYWTSPACREHYSQPREFVLQGNATLNKINGSSSMLATEFEAKEDCNWRRYRLATVVVPVYATKRDGPVMVYIENRRAASETIRNALRKFLGASPSSCGHHQSKTLIPKSCLSYGRCTSDCLLHLETTETLFSFTFVRNPVSRFYSGMEACIAAKTRTHPCGPDLLPSRSPSTFAVRRSQPPSEKHLLAVSQPHSCASPIFADWRSLCRSVPQR